MAYTVSVDLHHAEIHALLVDRVRKIGSKVQNVARRRAKYDTGRLIRSIHVIVNSAPGFVFADIGTNLDYGLWTHEGTGIYNTGRYIRPTRARFMKFKPSGRQIGPVRGSGKFNRGPRKPQSYAYASKVKGQPGNRWLVSALIAVVGANARIRRFRPGGRRGG